MWYEILPSIAIISVCMSLPNFLSKYLNLAVDGKPYRRDMIKPWNLDTLMRDERLTGDPYKTVVSMKGFARIFSPAVQGVQQFTCLCCSTY
ncbi:unnamed protein product [Ixodes pacificus]